MLTLEYSGWNRLIPCLFIVTALSQYKTSFPGTETPIRKIRMLSYHLIFMMSIPILVYLIVRQAPGSLPYQGISRHKIEHEVKTDLCISWGRISCTCSISLWRNEEIMYFLHNYFIINTLRLRQDGRHFPDDIFQYIFLNENVWILINISMKFLPKGPNNNNPSLFQVMAWRRSGDKPLCETMMISWLTYICVTRPQWVKG